jgi:hypothetical protein
MPAISPPPFVEDERKLGRPPITLTQVVLLVGVLLAMLVVLDFNQRLAAAQRLRDAANTAQVEVQILETEQAILVTQVAYATTDAAVIEWAHEQGKSVQPGEVLVVPILPTPPPTIVPHIVTAPALLPNWMLWWSLFFDATPALSLALP